MMYPLVFGVVAFLYVTQGFSLIDTENQNLTDFLLNIPTGKDSDVLRQLLNQETIIRMSMVKNLHLLMQDVVTLKEDMVSMKDMVDSLKRESEELKRENLRLNDENLNQKRQLDFFNTTIKRQLDVVNMHIENITSDILQISISNNEFERHFEEKRENFERNISGILGDIKIEVRYLSVTLLDLNDHTREIEKSIPERLEENSRSVFEFVNKTYDKLTVDLSHSNGRQLELLSAVSDLKVFRDNVTLLLPDDIDSRINDLQENVRRWTQDRTKLSLAVTSLELLHSKEKVGFTVGVTSQSSSWSGSTLVFDKVISDIGGGYSTSTGIFTSPTDGTFVFYIAIMSPKNQIIYFDIVLNGNRMVRTMAWQSSSSNVFQTGTNMVVLRIQKGDKVWAQRYTGSGYHSSGIPIITFSGFRIY